MPSLKAAKLFCIRDCVRVLKETESTNSVKNPLHSLDISAKEQLLTMLKVCRLRVCFRSCFLVCCFYSRQFQRLNATSMWKLYSCWLSGERYENELVSVLMKARVEKLLEKRGLFSRTAAENVAHVTVPIPDDEETICSDASEEEPRAVRDINPSQPITRKANLKSFFVGSLGAAARAPKPAKKKELQQPRSRTPKKPVMESRNYDNRGIRSTSSTLMPSSPAQKLSPEQGSAPLEELHPSWAARVQRRATIQTAVKPQQHLTFD